MKEVEQYSILAAGYDLVMAHVDYPGWAGYVHGLLQDFAPDTRTVLELGCGTGSLGLELADLGPYRYAGTDLSSQMVKVARLKAKRAEKALAYAEADFTDFAVDRPVDALLLLYDGLNYVVESARLSGLFICAYAALKPGGIFVFDQSTPANSLNNEAYFEDSGESQGFTYSRSSEYDPETRLHRTQFLMGWEGHEFHEEHLQRAYDMQEVAALVGDAGLEILHTFDGFTRDSADEGTERVHWVVRRPV